MASNKFLKVTGILMIIGGGVGIIVGILAVAGVAVLAALGANSGLLTFGAILSIISAVVSLIAGIAGVKNAAKPEKAQALIVYGALTAAMSILGIIFTMAAGGSFSFMNVVTGLVLPALYLFGAFQLKKGA